MKKPLLICIIGESGSGKSTLADAVEEKLGIPQLRSYTDRARRNAEDNGHTFLTEEEFNKIDRGDMIAYTLFGTARYCCVHSDVTDTHIYVIDEDGYIFLMDNHADRYEVVAIRLYRLDEDRRNSVGEERISRDAGKFNLPMSAFDYLISNLDNNLEKFVYDGLLVIKFIVNDYNLKQRSIIPKSRK